MDFSSPLYEKNERSFPEEEVKALKPTPDNDLRSMLPDELKSAASALGAPAYRAEQLNSWLRKGADSFAEMTNLPAGFRERLSESYFISGCRVTKKAISADGTVKYLFSLYDGETIEAVLMEYHHGNTLCISSQAGCRMGCGFCATGLGGLQRNLLPGEMLGQISAARRDSGRKISNVVLMGMGEPLDNFENVARFLTLTGLPGEDQIGARHISLSTCGIVPGIYRLMELRSQITLSVSLHAPNDEIRSKMMPVNKRWGVDTLLAACRDYTKATGRRVTFEYALVKAVNDSTACALELAGKLSGMLCHVNLIPVNPVQETGFASPQQPDIRRFEETLRKRGISVTVRRTLGSDISASCGQLRSRCLKGDVSIEDCQ